MVRVNKMIFLIHRVSGSLLRCVYHTCSYRVDDENLLYYAALLVFIDKKEILRRVNKALSLLGAAIIRVCEIMEMLIKGPLVLTLVFLVVSQSP